MAKRKAAAKAAEQNDEQAAAKAAEQPKAKLVKMARESDGLTADVHPAEVENYKTGGFKLVQ